MTRHLGALLVGQSGGPTAVINASLAGILEEAAQHSAIDRLYGMVNGLEGALAGHLLDLTGESPQTVQALRTTPGACLGSCRRKFRAKDEEAFFALLARHNVRYFLYAGGNDSMDTCQRVREAAHRRGYELHVVGVPKTIDNDLARTDHCPGYGSAARFVAQTTRDTGLDLVSLRTFVPVAITEVMGRNAGWLVAAATLGRERPEDPPHLVYMPERPFHEERFLADVLRVYRELGYVGVAVSEGVCDARGGEVGAAPARAAAGAVDAFGHSVDLAHGVASYLADLVKSNLGLAARANRPGTIQRASSAHYSAVDVAEAVAVGRAAVRQVVSDDDGVMITLVRAEGEDRADAGRSHPYACTTGLVPLAEVANMEKKLPDAYITAAGNGITEAFRAYALPLIGDPLPPVVRLVGRPVAA